MWTLAIEKRTVAGKEVFIRQLNGGETATKVVGMLSELAKNPALIFELGSLLMVSCLCNESGERIYTDVNIVRESVPAGVLAEFVPAALDVSGLKDDAEDIEKK